MSDAPDKIYLQWIPGYPRIDADDEVTWCEDQINDDDIEYVKEATATRHSEAETRRLGLLEDYNEGLQRDPDCFSCGIMTFNEDTERWEHASDCELAAEVGDG